MVDPLCWRAIFVGFAVLLIGILSIVVYATARRWPENTDITPHVGVVVCLSLVSSLFTLLISLYTG